ncbi:phosphopantetheine-binding protein [Nocardiopsis dassonvillei]|uniref:acyl carrier protein n=1 Tax=Nocardiopsis dassonvillei TaxID=2014 RepID=UPI00102B5278|nr:phosphopantetheine-binding protein [Nocardiopsis dassonvillei]MCP3013965.1 phosphopantetheine-binding protein [Nocardiopsis dassonvillei]
MQRTTVITALEAALSEALEREVSSLDGGVRLFDDLHLDSTSMLEVLMSLEESIGLEVSPEDLEIEVFESVDTLTDFVLSTRAPAV